jgi:hypothetical protein
MHGAVGVGVLCAVFAGPACSAADTKTDPDRDSYAEHIAGKRSLIAAAESAAVQQARNSPREWGQGAAGFAKRFGSSFGKHVVKGSVEFVLAGPLHEDLKYHRSETPGVGPRLEHALLSTVLTRKTTDGTDTIAVARISGTVTGGFVSRLWQPARLRTFASGAGSVGVSFGVDAGFNVVREFWPEIRHPRRKERP